MMPLPEFLETYSLSSLQAIKADLTDHYSGQPLLQQMLDKIVTPDDYRYPSMSGGCFIAGTMVWTDNGLVPIDQLKVGDSVLSQPESTGEKAYRKVVRTMSYHDKEVYCVRYNRLDDDSVIHTVYATGNHPFWVEGIGWTAATLLESGQELQLQDGAKAAVLEVVPVYKTDRPGVGWEPYYIHSNEGCEADFSNGWKIVGNDKRMPSDAFAGDPFLRVDVYNIEVEGFHTYYIGETGVWVHNANCNIELFTPGWRNRDIHGVNETHNPRAAREGVRRPDVNLGSGRGKTPEK
jgi:hypothetical protein